MPKLKRYMKPKHKSKQFWYKHIDTGENKISAFKKYGTATLIALSALILLAGGGAKLAGVPEVHMSFGILGLPSWFAYFIGVCEVAGAIGLFIRPLRALAAAGISGIMLGAVYFHVMHTPLAQGIPALFVLLSSVYIALQSRDQLFKMK